MSHDEALIMMEGLAIGDALGAYPEFYDLREASDNAREYKEGGPHRLKAGYWKMTQAWPYRLLSVFSWLKESLIHIS